MKSFGKALQRFYKDEKAAEVTELGIVLALIVAVCVLVIAAIGPKIQQAYQDVDDALTPA